MRNQAVLAVVGVGVVLLWYFNRPPRSVNGVTLDRNTPPNPFRSITNPVVPAPAVVNYNRKQAVIDLVSGLDWNSVITPGSSSSGGGYSDSIDTPSAGSLAQTTPYGAADIYGGYA